MQRQVAAEKVVHAAENEGGEHVGLVVPIFAGGGVGQGVGEAEELLFNQLVHIVVEMVAAGVHFPQGEDEAAAVYPVGGFGHHFEEHIKAACLETGEHDSAVLGFEIGNHLAGQIAFAGVVFVEGGTVYRGAFEDILHGDLGEGFFVQQIHKGFADGAVGFDDAGVGIAFVFAHVGAFVWGFGRVILRFSVCLSNFFTGFVCLAVRGIVF